jgi:hypothetical protein
MTLASPYDLGQYCEHDKHVNPDTTGKRNAAARLMVVTTRQITPVHIEAGATNR